MFISYNYKRYHKDGKNSWGYELRDSEFGTVVGEAILAGWGMIATAIIHEYSKRNLNVAANLAVAFVWFNKQHPNWSIQYIIDHNKKHTPLFQQYEDDLQKYLVLL
jgi:hypothetical protein